MAEDGKPKVGDGPGRLRPTIVGPAALRPRESAIAATTEPAAVGLPQKPRGLSEPVRPKPSSSIAPASLRPIARPTAIQGAEPERVMVEMEDLRRLAPQARPAVLKRALALVRGFVVNGASERQAVLWGHETQQEYGLLVSQGLELARADALQRVAIHVNRMTTILGSIDLEAACGAGPAPGVFSRLVRSTYARIDTPEELEAARGELDQIVQLLGETLPDLLSLKQSIEQHWQRIEVVGDETEAAALAAEFLAMRLQEKRPTLSRRYLDRSISLTQTTAQIREAASLRDAQIEQPARLVAVIQDVVLVRLPAWLGSVAALEASAAGHRRVTSTEAGELAHRLRGLLQQLNS